jgi:hypothetical protein
MGNELGKFIKLAQKDQPEDHLVIKTFLFSLTKENLTKSAHVLGSQATHFSSYDSFVDSLTGRSSFILGYNKHKDHQHWRLFLDLHRKTLALKLQLEPPYDHEIARPNILNIHAIHREMMRLGFFFNAGITVHSSPNPTFLYQTNLEMILMAVRASFVARKRKDNRINKLTLTKHLQARSF